MGSKTTYLENALLAHVLGDTAYTAPSTLYAVLSDAAFDPTKTGTTVSEISTSSGYARVSLTNDTTNFPAPTGGNPASLSNGTDWAFPTPTFDWGTVMSIYLADASSGGNLLYGTDVTGSGVDVVAGQQFTVNAGDFIVRET